MCIRTLAEPLCEPRSIQEKSLRTAIGNVPRETALFNDTIRYNIHYGRTEASGEEVFAAARAAHIHEFIETLPAKCTSKDRGRIVERGSHRELLDAGG